MRCVWDLGAPTARDVADALFAETSWAYTTVKTLMTRLVAKGALAERKRGHVASYEARLSRRDARKDAVASLLDRAFDGSMGPLVHFLVHDEKLSRKDRAALRRLLEEEGGGR
jgi:predicted transcriptional regulator